MGTELKTRSGHRASQVESELSGFLTLLKSESVTSYLEIGARHGDTFYDVMRSLPPGSKGLAVDLPGGAWGTHSSRGALKTVIAELREQGYKASCLFGDSQTDSTHMIVKGRGPFDAALIDGDHRYAGVHADWARYGPMARLVAFHDIDGAGVVKRQANGENMHVEVPQLWAELKAAHRHVEFVEADNPRPMGIGVLWR